MSENKNQMWEQMQEAIRKNMPEQVGGELKKLLDNYQDQKRTIERLEHENKVMSDLTAKQGAELREHKTLDEKLKSIDTREADLAHREREMKISKLKTELACSNREARGYQEFMLNFSKNVMVKRRFFGEAPSGTVDACGMPTKVDIHNSEDETAE